MHQVPESQRPTPGGATASPRGSIAGSVAGDNSPGNPLPDRSSSVDSVPTGTGLTEASSVALRDALVGEPKTDRFDVGNRTIRQGNEGGPSASEPVGAFPDAADAEPVWSADEVSTTGDAPAGPIPGDHRDGTIVAWLGLAVALACSLFVFVQMRPDLLFMNTTPSGGDMGAHVWGPAYLRDNLLSEGRLTGWTPDWYAGFPAYQFYMVVPSLAIVALNAGFDPIIGGIAAAIVLAIAGLVARRNRSWAAPLIVGAVVVSLLLISVPYGVAFKLVSVSGLVAFPVAAWALGRMSSAAEPIPAFMALGATVFLFDTNFQIYGGNIASTLAGEFAFSIGLCLSLVAMGLAIRGMDRHSAGLPSSRAMAAVVIALVALSHLIPLFFVLLGLAILMLADQKIPRLWILAIAATFCVMPMALADDVTVPALLATVGAAVAVGGAVVAADEGVRGRFVWLGITGPVAALLASFWLVPFYLQSSYFNDMGWERKDLVGPLLLTEPMKIALPVAAIGAVLALATRDRMGVTFSIMAGVFAMAVANLGEGKLWNARLLPFFYLCVYLTAAIAIALLIRFVAAVASERLDRPDRRVLGGGVALGLVLTLVGLAIPLRALPGGGVNEAGVHEWFGFRSYARSFIPSWVAWNYSGYEQKPAYLEYRNVIDLMAGLGETNGCGRAMWEYDAHLERYGTPMALMLLPHWTDGCIGSMEGLYFESSATTPFHFLNQSTLSSSPSRAQRDLPYLGFDIDTGIEQLHVMGVRYYMAQTDTAIAAAQDRDDLTEVGRSEPFVVFELDRTSLVVGLETTPVVASGPSAEQAAGIGSRFDVGWESQAVKFYNDPTGYDALPAEDGPADWPRVGVQLPGDGTPVANPAEVSNLRIDNDRISFSVDQIGSPVLVKTSYFPNWDVSGADGPYRVGPNLMVVVPTDTDVRLSYGYTFPDYLGYVMTLVGLGGLAWLIRRDHRSPSPAVVGPDNGSATAATSTDASLFASAGRPVAPPSAYLAGVEAANIAALNAIVKAYDIRGTYPDQINATIAEALGVGFADYIRSAEPDAGRIVIGRDMRPSGTELVAAFAQGVQRQGLDVVDIGLASTDMVYFASGSLGCPGVMFTASHNPAGYNGIKMCRSGAAPIGQESGLADVKAVAADVLADRAPSAAAIVGATSSQDLLGAFADHVRSFVDISKLRPLKVVADTANGMGGLVVPAAFQGLPFELDLLYPELDGTFPNHPADPLDMTNLVDLQARVLEVGADIGLAFDGDADRVFLVDERGRPVSGSLTTALLARAILAEHPGRTVVHNLICSKVVPEVIAESGGVAFRSRVGHSFIKAHMAEEDAVFGGEHSAHYYFADNWRADSGLIATMFALAQLSEFDGPLSELLAPLDRYASSGEINTRVADVAAVIDHVAQHYGQTSEGGPATAIDRLDGLTVDLGDWWFNLRPSNTEPLLRLNLEAATVDEVAARVAEVQAVMGGA